MSAFPELLSKEECRIKALAREIQKILSRAATWIVREMRIAVYDAYSS